MPLPLEDILNRLGAALPDDDVRKQAAWVVVGERSNELLAQFVVNVAASLYDLGSTDGANLERIAVNLEDASFDLAAASRRLRRLAEPS